jgi:hypothetical protein
MIQGAFKACIINAGSEDGMDKSMGWTMQLVYNWAYDVYRHPISTGCLPSSASLNLSVTARGKGPDKDTS